MLLKTFIKHCFQKYYYPITDFSRIGLRSALLSGNTLNVTCILKYDSHCDAENYAQVIGSFFFQNYFNKIHVLLPYEFSR